MGAQAEECAGPGQLDFAGPVGGVRKEEGWKGGGRGGRGSCPRMQVRAGARRGWPLASTGLTGIEHRMFGGTRGLPKCSAARLRRLGRSIEGAIFIQVKPLALVKIRFENCLCRCLDLERCRDKFRSLFLNQNGSERRQQCHVHRHRKVRGISCPELDLTDINFENSANHRVRKIFTQGIPNLHSKSQP